ncbi:MAG: aminoacyl-tRNA hydrolase [Candidatus Omnitrophica bacterium]|nr:aminoacyl-tRNA hydrolase [Candidatus Omnitrophota bacterium]
MKLIVGLGNPGLFYSGSRHNIGFQVVKRLAKTEKIALKKEKGILALTAKFKLRDEFILLALPLTFMNLSGDAVKSLIRKYKIDLKDLLIVCDDLDLAFGRFKMRKAGSSAGHKGVSSIINSLGKDEFNRLRIGIGRPKGRIAPAEFVLKHFDRKELQVLPAVIEEAQNSCRCWVVEGIDKCMNIFNRSDNAKGVKA